MSSNENSDGKNNGFLDLSETERLKRDMYRPDMEKLHLFTAMLRRNAILKKVVIRHK